MTNDPNIPPEALEAAARAQYAAWVKLESAATGMHVGDFEWWEGLGKDGQDEWLQQARAACLAMLRAWPRAYTDGFTTGRGGGIGAIGLQHRLFVILPLTQEPTND